MRILLTESEWGAAAAAARDLRDAGYEIVRCHAATDRGDECVVFRGLADCPLHSAPVDVVVDVRARGGPATAREFGADCAIRNDVPLIVAGPADRDRFPWSRAEAVVASPADVIEACDSVLAPADTAVARAVAATARRTLSADGVHTDVIVSVVHGAGDTTVFVAIPASVDRAVIDDVTAAVRLAASGRKGFPERPGIVVDGCG